MPRKQGHPDRCPRCNVIAPKHATCADCGNPVCWSADECKCGAAIQFGGALALLLILIALSQFLA